MKIATEHLKSGGSNLLTTRSPFGEHGKVPPIVIELPGGEQIILEGRIDRVDIAEDGDCAYVKVIGYKSGERKFDISDAFYGLQIQLVVYLDAVLQSRQNLVKQELYPAGAFYFKIKDPMVGSRAETQRKYRKPYPRTKMSGMIIKDIDVIKHMDREVESSSKSDIVSVKLKKDGDFYKKSSSLFDRDEFSEIMTHTQALAKMGKR